MLENMVIRSLKNLRWLKRVHGFIKENPVVTPIVISTSALVSDVYYNGVG